MLTFYFVRDYSFAVSHDHDHRRADERDGGYRFSSTTPTTTRRVYHTIQGGLV